MKKNKRLNHKYRRIQYSTISMTFFLAAMVFVSCILIFTIVIILLRYAFQVNISLASFMPSSEVVSRNLLFVLVLISCLLVGYGLTLLLSKGIMHPVKKVTQAMEELSTGNYKKRLSFKIKMPLFDDISFSFNRMAEEREHTEMLSNDFINNFSHEFKTPISSISGFAKLLRKGNLSQEQIQEYLGIIEEESSRLTGMATSILKLTKVENQTILTDVKKFNLSEQIRNCVLLLEDRWSSKDINIDVDFDEFFIYGNEELLKEVWINLFDNAIKYTPNGGTISFNIKSKEDKIVVYVTNTGSEIPAEHQLRIFNKFYQVDHSHSAKGSGVGLAVVKKIVTLHNGEVFVISGNKKTIFVVNLPY